MQSLAAGIGLMAQSLSMSTSDQAIWPHSPKSLLPLLERYLPYSLSVQSLVAGTQYAEPDQPISTRPSPVLSDDDCISHVWCTFPPSAIDDPPIPFHIMAIVPRPQENTTRSFCSAEAVPHTAGDESTTAKLVTDSFKTLHELYPFVTLAGGVHERWVKPMLKAFDAEERILTWMWLSPKGGSAALTLDETATQARLQKDGLMLDVGREGDAQIVSDPLAGVCHEAENLCRFATQEEPARRYRTTTSSSLTPLSFDQYLRLASRSNRPSAGS